MIKAERRRVRAISAPHWACNGYSSAPTGRAVLDLDTRGTSQEQLGTEAAQGKPHLFPEELPAPSPPLPPAFPCKCALPTAQAQAACSPQGSTCFCETGWERGQVRRADGRQGRVRAAHSCEMGEAEVLASSYSGPC